jgi:hypothetical protein
VSLPDFVVTTASDDASGTASNCPAGGGGSNTFDVFQQEGNSITFSPSSLNFSNVPVNQAVTQVVTVINTGSVVLNLGNISFTGAGSSVFGRVTNCIGTMPVGGTCTIAVGFHPTVAGSYPATMAVTSNVPGSPQTITITATAQ